MSLLSVGLAMCFILVCLPLLYLYLLLVASLGKLPPLVSSAQTRFAVAIPAHNEEMVIEGTIQSLLEADYPKELVDIHLVADNCTDDTASIARSLGVNVYERNTPERGGKGPALAWLFKQVFKNGSDQEALVIFDADTHLSPDFFQVMSARMQAGAQVVQGNHVIRNPSAGWFPALTWAMFLIDNRCQNLGRMNLGLSAKNMGDSICFKTGLLKWLGWGEGLAEDYEFRQKLLLKGIRIEYEPRAIGMGDAAANWTEARTQRARWLKGTYQASRKSAWSMLVESMRRRDLALLDGALQAYFPSYSTLTLLTGFFTVLSWGVASWSWGWLAWAWSIAFAAVFIYPLLALIFDKAPLRAFLVILTGPVFILWRTAITVSARFLHKNVHWVRTPRHTNSVD